MGEKNQEMSFWDHLDVLRSALFRTGGALIVVSVALFFFKEFLFDDIVLAPTRSDFFLYKWLGVDVSLDLVNIEVTAQFMIHMKVTFICAIILCIPYIIYEIWRFIAPGLFENEKKAVRGAFLFSSFLFYLGMVVGYVLVLPLMVNFFQGYKVSEAVVNTISLSSYISVFSSMILVFGLIFEFPAVVAALSRLGILYRHTLKKGWRYAVLTCVVLAALITPSGDPFSLMIVSVPLLLLYFFSIFVCKEAPAEPQEEDEAVEEQG